MLIHNLAQFRKVFFFCFISLGLGILLSMPLITSAQPADEDLAADKNAQQRAEQIYLFLSSEIAIQRGEIGPAYQTLLGLARSSKDPRVAQRAMELALSAQSPQFALEAAKLWDDLSPSNDSSSKEVLITLLMINNKWRESVDLTIAFLAKQNSDKQDAFLLQLQNIVSKAPNQDEALLAFSTIIDSLKPLTKNPNLLFLYALGQEKSGNYKTMESVLRGLLRNKPDDASVLNALGYSFADRNIRLDEALQLIEKAHQISPEDPYILDSVGWIYFRLGRFDLAIEYLEKSFNKLPEAEVGAHLGEVFWVTGKQEEAKAIWKKAEALNANHPVLKNTLKRLYPEWTLQEPKIQTQKKKWDGRFAVKINGASNQNGGSGAFTLTHEQLNDELEIRGPFGTSIAKIQVRPSVATLEQNGKVITAVDADQLVFDALGLPIPARGLSSWLAGFTRAGSPGTIKRNPLGQVSEIMQDGWQLSFTWTEKNALQRLNMNRSTDGQDIDIRLVFDLLND